MFIHELLVKQDLVKFLESQRRGTVMRICDAYFTQIMYFEPKGTQQELFSSFMVRRHCSAERLHVLITSPAF